MAAKSTKTEEVKLDIQLKGVKAKLQTARVALMQSNLKTSGKNDFAHFEFFQLKDFLPEAQKIFTKLGLTSNYTIMPRVIATNTETEGEKVISSPIIRDIARLVIKDMETDETEIFEMEAAPVQIGNNTKQNIYQAAGGRSTYYKRYLYRDALEIEEDDESDGVLGNPEVNYQTPQVTPYSFQQPVQPQATPIQQVVVEQSIPPVGQQVEINKQGNVQPVNIDSNVLISQESKEEVMKLIMSKNLDGYATISEYCKQNNISSPAELKESDKAGLMAYVGAL